jgi:hypothetical protein
MLTMKHHFTLLTVLGTALLQSHLTVAERSHPQRRTALHDCAVFVQRWYDSSFDVYDYASGVDSQAFADWDYGQYSPQHSFIFPF